ncbi:Tudor/PWWP/MBT domain-containing protein [Dioscorea alata]|uniref:Tudor/PWWP/MBT domain-containing protein n=1 Tax=Dioscorea alata TaxID=55571 RepID=A0ACB7U912_DIOAL|nr:Tudor/PWWP/MBT domain-containing protein [Dioscorea alata]
MQAFNNGKFSNGGASSSTPCSVFKVIGEPAIVINGVPNISSVGSGKPQFDAQRNIESKLDPLFGDWMKGREILKLFGNQYYSGKVAMYDAESHWYRVVYEDGDFEDLEWQELEEVLVPLDISVPLTTLALQRSRSDASLSSVSWSVKNSKSKRSGKGLGFQETLHLLQEPHPSEFEGKEIVSVNLMEENTQETIIGSKQKT